ncbi:hypothetical protein BKM03_21130 [Pseudomonas avellanae]|nr:hypothetical protein BKM03_21130 [Pseudomonas avellanae]POP87057.1 hypothetical protein CXB34_09120 [Pseudomonas amygdali pv. morsprunorum]
MTQTAISNTKNFSISRIIFLMDPFIKSSTTDGRVLLSSALTAKSAVYRQMGFFGSTAQMKALVVAMISGP